MDIQQHGCLLGGCVCPAWSTASCTGPGAALRPGLGTGDALADDSTRAASAAAADTPVPGTFRDVTAESGIEFTYRNGEEAGHYTMLESLGASRVEMVERNPKRHSVHFFMATPVFPTLFRFVWS